MINRNIVIAALARDCENTLPDLINQIEEFRKHFIWTEVIVVENDSIDDTKKILLKWKKEKSNINIISKDYKTLTIPNKVINGVKPLISIHRIKKMARYRNLYLDYINKIEHKIDNVIIIDLDIKSFPIKQLVAATQECTGNYGAIFANGITTKTFFKIFNSKLIYDTYAIYFNPITRKYSYTEKSLLKTKRKISKELKKAKKIEIISAFGGLGIYNYTAIKNLRYNVITNPKNNLEAVCEHIPFNTELIKQGYLNFIYQDIEVIYGIHSIGSILKYKLHPKFFKILYNTYKFIISKWQLYT